MIDRIHRAVAGQALSSRLDFLRQCLCILLALFAVSHVYGVSAVYERGTEAFVWSLGTGGLIASTAALNLVAQVPRPSHLILASAALRGCIAIALGVGNLVDDYADWYVLALSIPSLLLIAINVYALVHTRSQLSG